MVESLYTAENAPLQVALTQVDLIDDSTVMDPRTALGWMANFKDSDLVHALLPKLAAAAWGWIDLLRARNAEVEPPTAADLERLRESLANIKDQSSVQDLLEYLRVNYGPTDV